MHIPILHLEKVNIFFKFNFALHSTFMIMVPRGGGGDWEMTTLNMNLLVFGSKTKCHNYYIVHIYQY